MPEWRGMFTLLSSSSSARQGELSTPSGVVYTPFFMPDATRASVRGLMLGEVRGVGIGAMVVNTYHLLLQPGPELVHRAGGIHRFMDWDGPVLSDSGGYQVYSLIHRHGGLGKIDDEGVEFRSPRDGSKHFLTPERSIQIQFELGVDMMVCLDDPRPNDVDEAEATAAVERTVAWAKRCREEYDRQVAARGLSEENRPLLFSVVQGAMFPELRQRCARELIAIGFDGYGFGGRHVDEEGNFLEEIVGITAASLPEDKPRFALGVGKPEDIVRCYALGWDMFDCVIPTREGRHGRLFVWNNNSPSTSLRGRVGEGEESGQGDKDLFYKTININNEAFKEDFTPLDVQCDCDACRHYTRSYLRHLFAAGEPLAGRLASLHNLRFYAKLMNRLRS